MRILLGSILLATAIAAPIKDEESPAYPAFPTYPAVPTDHPSFPVDQYNRDMIAQEDALRTQLRAKNVSEEGIDYLIDNELHLLPVTADKIRKLNAWNKQWGFQEIESITFNEVVTDVEEEPLVKVVPVGPSQDPVESKDARLAKHVAHVREHLRGTVPEQAIDEYIASEFHLQPITPAKYHSYRAWRSKWGLAEITYTGQPSSVYLHPDEAKLLDFVTAAGLPQEAINELIRLDLFNPHFNEDKQRLYIKWCQKWMHEFPSIKEMHEVGKEITHEVADIFWHTYQIASAMKALQDEGEITEEKINFYKELTSHFSEFEHGLVQKVLDTVSKKIEKKYGNIDGKGIEAY